MQTSLLLVPGSGWRCQAFFLAQPRAQLDVLGFISSILPRPHLTVLFARRELGMIQFIKCEISLRNK